MAFRGDFARKIVVIGQFDNYLIYTTYVFSVIARFLGGTET